MLGICLGFQLMLEAEGATIHRQSQVLHGIETELETLSGSITYRACPRGIRVGRYHSLQVDPSSLSCLPETLRITGRDPIRDIPLLRGPAEKTLWLAVSPGIFSNLRRKPVNQKHSQCMLGRRRGRPRNILNPGDSKVYSPPCVPCRIAKYPFAIITWIACLIPLKNWAFPGFLKGTFTRPSEGSSRIDFSP